MEYGLENKKKTITVNFWVKRLKVSNLALTVWSKNSQLWLTQHAQGQIYIFQNTQLLRN